MYAHLDKRQPPPFKLPPTATYLGEDENGYYHMDGFFDGLTNMFKRMVKFTPKSFQPKNILKAVTNTVVGTATFGGAYLLPKDIRKTVFKAGEYVVPAVGAAIGAAILAPVVMPMLSPVLSSAGGILGKNASSIGGSLFGLLGKLSPSQQGEIAGQVTAQDVVYAETHGGQYPPHIMALIEKAEREAFEYAAAQTANSIMTPAQRALPPPETGSSTVYYGLIQEQKKQLEEAQAAHTDQLLAVGAIAGGVVLLTLLVRR